MMPLKPNQPGEEQFGRRLRIAETSELVSDQVLLLVGLLPPRIARSQTLPETNELRELLMVGWQRLQGRAWPWRLRDSVTRLIRSQDDASRLVQASDELLSEAESDWSREGRGLRLEVNIPVQYDPLTLYDSLIKGGAHSAFLRSKSEGEFAWSWPLRIGVAGDSALLAGIGPNSSLKPLFTAFDYERASMRANLLLLEGSLLEVSAALERMQRRPQSDALIVFGGTGETHSPVFESLSLLSETTGAQGIFIFDRLDQGRAQSFTEGLIALLSHDLPLDSAVARLSRESGVPVSPYATRRFVEATSVREQGRILARQLQRMSDVSVQPPSKPPVKKQRLVRGVRGRAKETVPVFGMDVRDARELGQQLEQRLEVPKGGRTTRSGNIATITFDRESDGARKLADVANAFGKVSDADTARKETRYLQARVETPAGRAIQGQGRLLPSRDYVATVFIGAPSSNWLSVGEAFESPEPSATILLDVLFWEPQASPEPQITQLILLPQGDTGIAEFPFRTTENQSVFSARIAVYHRNRNLQTGLLKGNVGDQPAQLTFTVDAAPVPKFVGLMDRSGVGASIIVNDDAYGNIQAFTYSQGQASVVNVSDEKPTLAVDVDPTQGDSLAKLTAALGRTITSITQDPDKYSDLSKEGSRTLLLDLALHGSALLTRLRKHSLMGDQFDRVGYIQIVSAHVDAFFPVEYFYDGEAPDDNAGICSGGPPEDNVGISSNPQAASDALASGKCCGAYDKSPRKTICPLRFWSMSKVIERHAHLPEHSKLPAQFQLRSASVSARNRLLDPLSGSVLAASTVADAAEKDTVENLIVKLNRVLRKETLRATSWASWAKGISDTHPSLLVLLPHHLQEGGFDSLEIGGDKLKSMQIHPEHVRALKDPNTRPIVLLIGCQTSSAKIDLESFVPVFQDNGAVIIVSTIATILGRQAGPAAAAIVEEIKKQDGNPNATFGDVMLAVRRRLLAEGTPMVLGLTSYGDADWRIGQQTNEVA